MFAVIGPYQRQRTSAPEVLSHTSSRKPNALTVRRFMRNGFTQAKINRFNGDTDCARPQHDVTSEARSRLAGKTGTRMVVTGKRPLSEQSSERGGRSANVRTSNCHGVAHMRNESTLDGASDAPRYPRDWNDILLAGAKHGVYNAPMSRTGDVSYTYEALLRGLRFNCDRVADPRLSVLTGEISPCWARKARVE
jgi:hypothetical protein